MSAKKSTKREFDWRSYSKPPRLLPPELEEALSSGPLRPLLELASLPDATLEIRNRQAALYYRGASLARVALSDTGFSAVIDESLRLPRADRPAAEQLSTRPLDTPVQIEECLAELAEIRSLLDSFAAHEPPSARSLLAQFARANRVAAESAEILVVDIEYQYGRRRFDFVGMRRAQGVGGAAAFSTPRLVIGELFTGHRSPSTSLISFGAEAAEFAHALSGEHLTRARGELAELARQRQRLGVLAEMPFSHFAEGSPELLVAFTDRGFSGPALDAPLAELHDRAVARHFPPELLRFAAVGSARPESGDHSLTVHEEDLLPYRAFKGLRKRLQG